jgi:hypothetical protein
MERIDWLGLEIAHALGKWKLGALRSLGSLGSGSTYKAMQLVARGNFCICVKPNMNRATRAGVHRGG